MRKTRTNVCGCNLAELVEPKIGEHRGRTVKTTGDGLLAEFASGVAATRCAVEVQRGMLDGEAVVPDERRIRCRIGINLGDIEAKRLDHNDTYLNLTVLRSRIDL